MASFTDDISINTLVGSGSFISGNVNVDGFVRVDGDIDGDLTTTGKIIIGEKARIHGNVDAKAAIIGGIVEGDVVAPEGIQLFSSAIVLGDLISRRIQAEENVILEGYCISIENEQSFEEAKNQWQDMRAISKKNIFGKIK